MVKWSERVDSSVRFWVDDIEVSSAILEPNAIKSILTYLKLPDKAPELAPARIPEQSQFA